MKPGASLRRRVYFFTITFNVFFFFLILIHEVDKLD